ncbi:MAG: hypothetical protein J8272_00450, partial ['Prunus persica' phytoplasma PP2]|nr:hypothetical protein ['Prunus persica' phytoplasma PP2]
MTLVARKGVRFCIVLHLLLPSIISNFFFLYQNSVSLSLSLSLSLSGYIKTPSLSLWCHEPPIFPISISSLHACFPFIPLSFI